MKISQIKINGVRGFNYQVDPHTNEETPHQINIPKDNSFILFGENGTGKSSFFDALEWALTGEIEEESKQRRIETKNFIKNIHSSNNPKVSVSFHSFQEELIRELGSSKHRRFEYELLAPYHFIESNRITVFVTDTKNSLWRRFLELIGLDELLEFQTQITYAKSEIENEALTQKKKLGQKELEKQKKDEKNELLVNKLNEKFNLKWINLSTTSETPSNIKLKEAYKSIIDGIDTCKKNDEEVEKFISKEKGIEKNLHEAKTQISFSNIAQLLEQAETYFKVNPNIIECPICHESTINQIVIENITKQKQKVNLILDLEKQKIDIIGKISNKRAEWNRHLFDTLQRYNRQFNQNIIFENADLTHKFLVSLLDKIQPEYENLSKSIEIQIDNDFREYHDNLKSIETLNKEITEIKEDFLLKDEILKDYEVVATKYKSSYDLLLEDELKNISEQYVTEIYNQLNQTDNEIIDSFKIEHDVSKQEIKFSAILKYTGEVIDPISMLSTAHLKCLGFSLLMARVKKKNSLLKFIAIDDPIYAIDHEHRYSLINYLCKESKDYQFIITTSDRNFFDIFRNKIGNQKLTTYKTYLDLSPKINSVLLKESPKDYIEEAIVHLNANDYRASALYARIALENCLFEVAKNQKIKMNLEIGKRQNISLDEIFKKVGTDLKVKFPDKSSIIDTQFETIRNNTYFKTLLTSSPLNKEIHQTHELIGFLNTKSELEEIIQITNNFKSFISSVVI